MNRRYAVSKSRSARKFRRHSSRTKGANMYQPLRGGWRL